MAGPRFTGDRRLIAKAKQKKVAKYRLFSSYKKALRDEARDAGSTSAPASSGHYGAAPDPYAKYAQQEDAHGAAAAPAEDGERKFKKKKKMSAAEAARKKWEQKQVEVQAERDAAIARKEQRNREIEAARKRRSDQASKLSKRTKRGQPVLGNQVEHLLARIQRGGA